jgi:translation initiation factor 5B
MAEPEEPNIVEANDSKVTKSEAVAETSKKKKKKKKSGRTAQEKDD